MSEPSKQRLTVSRPTRTWLVVLLTTAVALGLSVAAGGAVAASQSTEHEPLAITTECTDETSTVTVTNPNDVPAELTMTWEGDQSSIQLSASSESVQTDTEKLELATELTADSLTAAVPADESITVEGLEDGTYDLSAVADGDDVPLETDELTLECATETTDESAMTMDGHVSGPTVDDDEKGDHEKDVKDDEKIDEKDEYEKDDVKDDEEVDKKDDHEKDDVKDDEQVDKKDEYEKNDVKDDVEVDKKDTDTANEDNTTDATAPAAE
ncbi:hypothetical protein RBH26_09055 [Natronolimnohabitans sp. A-GB9]|uniref:hypothetical protein n=1 Tax=Natronolimnohabitans sp. A-GB9 TaxID=3069757 RepID=UPI0027B58985|nr:hypothetical protein [Natronolimnohabitans sp. A-GB9]MDQ2050635.1 hypothetical protein [Natronolimnohabitans sp. A-GB9]